MVEGKATTDDAKWDMADILGKNSETAFYQFEGSFEPYARFWRNDTDAIDLIVWADGSPVRPLEVKLTVVPDSITSKGPKSEWAPELVMRPVSSAYAMLGIASSLLDDGNREIRGEVVDKLKVAYNCISDWKNESEALKHKHQIVSCLKAALHMCEAVQRPFLLQPIWRTSGQSLKLCDRCFDVFVWSDASVMSLPIQECKGESRMTRSFREVARHVRGLYDILQTGDFDYSGIYKGITHRSLTDRSFSISGKSSIKYMYHKRLEFPVLPASELSKIVLNGGESELKPERRFDAAVQAHMNGQQTIE